MRVSLVLLSLAAAALGHKGQHENPLDDSTNSIAELKQEIEAEAKNDPFELPKEEPVVHVPTLKVEKEVPLHLDSNVAQIAVNADGSMSTNPFLALSGLQDDTPVALPKGKPVALSENHVEQSHVNVNVDTSNDKAVSFMSHLSFLRAAVELLASEGDAFTKIPSMAEESKALFTLTVVTAIGSLFVLLGLCYWVSHRTGSALKMGKRTLGELIGLTAFRFYSGFLMCTWLPFLLAEEGALLWPDHQSLFMGIGKMILATAMILCPIFGLLNDQTLHTWGRRRAWFMAGVGLILLGVASCAFASASRMSSFYFVGTICWCVGESIAESTTEALVPDLVPEEDYNKAASVRGVMFMAGGFVGYGLIIVSAELGWNPAVFYVYYLVMILAGAPWSIYYACPSDAEKRALERRNDPSLANQPLIAGQEQVPGDIAAANNIVAADGNSSMFQRCYVDCYYASPEFRYVSLATVYFSMSTSGMMFVMLILRDLVGLDDSATAQFHMACSSIVMMVPAALASVVMGFVDVSPNNRYTLFGVFLFIYIVTEMSVPCVHFLFEAKNDKLAYLYGVAAVKGFAFGGIYNIMQPITWEAIPDSWKSGVGAVSRATAFISVARSFGVGLGNFACGLILDGVRDFYTPAGQESALKGQYPISGYFALFTFTSLMLIITGIVLQKCKASKARGSFVIAPPTAGIDRGSFMAPPADPAII